MRASDSAAAARRGAEASGSVCIAGGRRLPFRMIQHQHRCRMFIDWKRVPAHDYDVDVAHPGGEAMCTVNHNPVLIHCRTRGSAYRIYYLLLITRVGMAHDWEAWRRCVAHSRPHRIATQTQSPRSPSRARNVKGVARARDRQKLGSFRGKTTPNSEELSTRLQVTQLFRYT